MFSYLFSEVLKSPIQSPSEEYINNNDRQDCGDSYLLGTEFVYFILFFLPRSSWKQGMITLILGSFSARENNLFYSSLFKNSCFLLSINNMLY